MPVVLCFMWLLYRLHNSLLQWDDRFSLEEEMACKDTLGQRELTSLDA